MDFLAYRPAIGLMVAGAVLWIIGILLMYYVPALPPVGAVLILFGQILFWIGLVILVIQLIVKAVKGLL